MKSRYITVALLASASMLSGCLSNAPKHSCPLNSEDGYCADLETVYGAAVRDQGSKENVLEGVIEPISDGKSDKPQTEAPAPEAPVVHDEFTGFMAAQDRGMPVFTPPKPHRLWIAPWHDANKILHGGEYLYYTTPGHWNYGTLTSPGDGAEVMGPIKPQDLGFIPVVGLSDEESLNNEPVEEHDGVVQPYQNYRLD